jgi:hypothetical protein
MRIRARVHLFAASATLLFPLLNNSALAQYSIVQAGPNNALLELNSFLHSAAATPPTASKPQTTPVSPQPQPPPQRPQASRLAVARPSVKAQKTAKPALSAEVRHQRTADNAAGRRAAKTPVNQIAQPLSPLLPKAAVACATNTAESVPDPIVAVVKALVAGPPMQPNAVPPAEGKQVSTPPVATNTAESTPAPVVAVVGTVAAAARAQPDANDPAEIKPPSPPGATGTAEIAPARVVAVAGTVAAGTPVQPDAGNPAEVKPTSPPAGATNRSEGPRAPVEVVDQAVSVPPP